MKNKSLFIPIVIIVLVVIVSIIYGIISSSKTHYSKNLFNEISYEVPSDFKKDEDYTYTRYYNYSENSVYCTFSVNVTEKEYYDDINDWFKEKIVFTLNDKVSELKEVTINNAKMLYVDKERGSYTDYYYGMETSKYYYLLTYSISDYKHGDGNGLEANICLNAKDKIIGSVNVR